jgi:LysM repeat protein
LAKKLSFSDQITLRTFAKDRMALFSSLGSPPTTQEPVAALVPPVKGKRHTVQSGMNLWKIARKYKVSIDALKKANRLETDKLRPCKELIIP